MNISDLKKELSTHIHDPASQVVVGDQLLKFVNSASRDANNSGLLIDLDEDTSLSYTGADLAVPADFTVVVQLEVSNTIFLPHEWRLIYKSGAPYFRFPAEFMTDVANGTLKVTGFKNPSTYTDDDDTVDIGIEGFIRERTVSYAAGYLARSGSNWSRQYQQLFSDAFAVSAGMMQELLAQLRERLAQYLVNRKVPGR